MNTETWADGKALTASVNIQAGATVTIAPGAKVTCASGVTITVSGTLKVASATPAHAKITCAGWTGIVVASGGTLAADGLDLENATNALHIMGGNTDAKFSNGVILASGEPFKMEPASKLSVAHSNITGTLGSSEINGAFTASYMNYDKGTNEGFLMADANASMFIEDSRLTGGGGGDYLVTNAGKLLHFSYSEVSGSHCPFHFNSLTKWESDHINVKGNAYGSMIYNAEAGPHVVSNSNFTTNASHDIEQTALGFQLTLDNVYLGSKNSVFASAPSIKNGAPKTAVAGTGPR